MAQSHLRALALDAACLSNRNAAACAAAADASGCAWEAGICGVDPDWADAKIAEAPTLGGCAGSLGAAVATCRATKGSVKCAAAADTCSWCVSAVYLYLCARAGGGDHAAGYDARRACNSQGPATQDAVSVARG